VFHVKRSSRSTAVNVLKVIKYLQARVAEKKENVKEHFKKPRDRRKQQQPPGPLLYELLYALG
jgi:hypothetical protein